MVCLILAATHLYDVPIYVSRPSISLNVQTAILSHVLATMQGVAQYHQQRRKGNRKRKRNDHDASRGKKRRTDEGHTTLEMPVDEPRTADDSSTNPEVDRLTNEPALEPPQILQHVTIGINEVTKRLESQIHKSRITVVPGNSDTKSLVLPLQVILVCRGDINPVMLVDHLPHLVAAYNSAQVKDKLILVTLPKGAEASMAQAMGLRRVAVVGMDVRRQIGPRT